MDYRDEFEITKEELPCQPKEVIEKNRKESDYYFLTGKRADQACKGCTTKEFEDKWRERDA